MNESLGRPNRLDVDLGAIAKNIRFLREYCSPKVKLILTLKANAYGYGLVPIGKYVESAGVDGLAVGDALDATQLREAGVKIPILMHSGTLISQALADAADRYDLIATVQDRVAAAKLAACGRNLKVFAKIDLGLERLGVHPEAATDFLLWLKTFQNLRLAGVYAHLHVPALYADLANYLDWQRKRFNGFVESAEKAGIEVPLKMVASTAVLRQRSDMMYDAVDPGNAIFGMDAGGTAKVPFNTHPALVAIRTALVQVHDVKRTEFLDAAPAPLKGVTRIGIIPLGFRDQFDRMHAGDVLVRGTRVPILGNSSLETTRIDLSKVPDAEADDEVIIAGRQGNQEITIEEIRVRNKHPRTLDLMMTIGLSIERRYL